MKTVQPLPADTRRAILDALLDHALEETFPASDPTAVSVEPPIVMPDDKDKARRGGKTKQ